MADRKLGKCKDCTKADVKARRIVRHEQVCAYDRERFKTPERKTQSRASLRRQRERHPEKARARNAVGNAVRDGRLARQPCEVCGTPKSQAHHDDYAKPLDVRWLCFRHHREHHGHIVSVAVASMAGGAPF